MPPETSPNGSPNASRASAAAEGLSLAGGSLRIHLIGIGGAGMAGLSRILAALGHRVTGSDQADSPLLAELKKLGIGVSVGHAAAHLPPGAQVAIATAAVRGDNPERQEAERRGIPVWKYAEAVGKLSSAARLLAVAGTHGKTTTSSWIAYALHKTGVSRSFLVGGTVTQLGTSAAWGGGDWLTLEACEYDRSFLNYTPTLAVLTNVDRDHMDYFQTFEALLDTFGEFLERVEPEGTVFLSSEEPHLEALSFRAGGMVETVGMSDNADWRIGKIAYEADGTRFRLKSIAGEDLGPFRVRLCGEHNVRNASMAILACLRAGAPLDELREAIGEFRGAGRRMELLGELNGAVVLDDYGHHPRELAATFSAIRQRYPDKKLRVLFQPHQYARTKYLFDEFVEILAHGPDELVLAPVYSVRDPSGTPPVTSLDLASAARKAGGKSVRVLHPEEAQEHFAQSAQPGDVILTIGAGDIWKVGHGLVRRGG